MDSFSVAGKQLVHRNIGAILWCAGDLSREIAAAQQQGNVRSGGALVSTGPGRMKRVKKTRYRCTGLIPILADQRRRQDHFMAIAPPWLGIAL
jgi:hypothetical protein